MFPERSTWETRLTSQAGRRGERKIRRLLAARGARRGGPRAQRRLVGRRADGGAVGHASPSGSASIHGVIHGAGNTSACGFADGQQHRPLDRRSALRAEGARAVRHRGTVPRPRPRFRAAASSLSGVLGGLGLLGYCRRRTSSSTRLPRGQNQARRVPWISVNWDAWQFPGRRGCSGERAAGRRFPLSGRRRRLLLPDSRSRARADRGVDQRR